MAGGLGFCGGFEVFLDLDPLAGLGGLLDGLEHAFVAQAILERGLDGLSVHDGVDEIGGGMNEGMFVAEDVAGGPP